VPTSCWTKENSQGRQMIPSPRCDPSPFPRFSFAVCFCLFAHRAALRE
jgi:hypothetical protein